MPIQLWPKDYERKEHITKAEKMILRNAARNFSEGHIVVGIDPLGMSSDAVRMGMYISPHEGLITFSLYQGAIDPSNIDIYLMYVNMIEKKIYERLLDSKVLINRKGEYKTLKFQYKHILIFPDEKIKALTLTDKGDRDGGVLTINRGMQGVLRVIDDIVNMLVDKSMITPKYQDLDDMFGLIQYYLKPLTDYLNNLTAEQRKNLRGYFGTGADTRFWRAFQKAIADVRPDFKPDGLDEYWQNETKVYNDETITMLNEIESKIKTIISVKLESFFGDSWLIKGLPKTTYTRAKREADEVVYQQISSDGEDTDASIWDYVTIADCKAIVLNGGNWSRFFEDTFVRPEETDLSGGKDAKTNWIARLSTIKNKLSKDSYSVPVDEYSFVKCIYDWLTGVLIQE